MGDGFDGAPAAFRVTPKVAQRQGLRYRTDRSGATGRRVRIMAMTWQSALPTASTTDELP
jgi:hypothetical protein